MPGMFYSAHSAYLDTRRLVPLGARLTTHVNRRKQNLNLTLICSQNDHDPNPRFISHAPGTLSMEWASPDACPRSGDGANGGSSDGGGSTGGGGGGLGFWGFIKFIFWCGLIGLLLYFAIGQSSLPASLPPSSA